MPGPSVITRTHSQKNEPTTLSIFVTSYATLRACVASSRSSSISNSLPRFCRVAAAWALLLVLRESFLWERPPLGPPPSSSSSSDAPSSSPSSSSELSEASQRMPRSSMSSSDSSRSSAYWMSSCRHCRLGHRASPAIHGPAEINSHVGKSCMPSRGESCCDTQV
jgi:hypothetical protein